MKHLIYSLLTAGYKCNENRHAQKVMKELGITYQHATPQSISDSWWFWNCENIPETLPPYLKEMDRDPMDCIGWGLSKESAEAIRDYKPGDLKDDGKRYQTQAIGDIFKVIDTKTKMFITKEIPDEKTANEICDDFNAMENGDFTPLGHYFK